jgi:hypothetical protein
LPDRVREGLQEFSRAGQHQRTPEAVANLLAGLSYFLEFAEEVGALTAAECRDTWDLARVVLEDVGRAQAGHHDDDHPVQRFVALLRAALTAGKAHLAGITGQAPLPRAEAFGWRAAETVASGYGRMAVPTGWSPLGDLIGWVDGEALYLEPESAYRVVQLMARDQQRPFPTSQRMLQKALAEAGMLQSTDRGKSRDTYTTRKTCGGVHNRPVLRLSSSLLTGLPGK